MKHKAAKVPQKQLLVIGVRGNKHYIRALAGLFPHLHKIRQHACGKGVYIAHPYAFIEFYRYFTRTYIRNIRKRMQNPALTALLLPPLSTVKSVGVSKI